MRMPSGDERTIAMVLMERVNLSDAVRETYARIARGDLATDEEVAAMRERADYYVTWLRTRGELPDGY